MSHIQSPYTELPDNCKSAADRMVHALAEEDKYADLNAHCQKQITELEDSLSRELKERVALVAYRV